MNFNQHSNLVGEHAFLGASKYHWLNYSDEKLVESYYSMLAVQEGTEMHELAANLIKKRVKVRGTDTFAMYVNDAIGYKMTPEQVLYFSDMCFGTADAICFRGKKLRIHDLKTGKIPAHMEQLRIYAALFCLEYDMIPGDLDIELRIYQNNEIRYEQPTAEIIAPIMDKIKSADKILRTLKKEM